MAKAKMKRDLVLLKKFLLIIGLLALFSLILTFFLEFRYFGDLGSTWNFVTKNFGRVFLFNSFIMFLIIMVFYAVTLKPWLSICIVSIVVTIVAYVNENKLASRMTPLLPEDLELATEVNSLTKFVDVGGLIFLFVGLLSIVIATVVLSKISKRFFALPSYLNITEDGSKKAFIITRLILLMVTCVVFTLSTNFIINNAGQKYQRVDLLGTTFTAWNQDRNYRENGFLIGFLYNCRKFETKKPETYSKEYVESIAKKYRKKESGANNLASLSDADYNIVIVLNESFYDPEIIKDYYPYSGGDITPNLHNIIEKYPSGQMYSLDYGGGTANIEFEALTGLTNYYTNTVPYTNLIPKAGDIPSVATWAKSNGYNTTAIHTYYGGMYKRNISLKNEGFDNFITSLDIDDPEMEPGSGYLNDRTAYREVLKTLDQNDKKQLIALITMQNHTPFGTDIYDGERDFKLLYPSEYKDEEVEKVETYFQLLHNSDKYLGEFISDLDGLDEKTIVLFFGDHSPGTFSKVVESDINLSRLTPYFIYANFDLELDAEEELPTTTPNCLANTLYNELGVKKPTLNYLLDTVCEKNPILAATYYGDNELTQTEILNEYETVTYDILSGKKYWVDITNW